MQSIIQSVATPQTALTILFVLTIIVFTPAIAIGLILVYEKLSIYHYLESTARTQSGLTENDGEPFWQKVRLVAQFNLAAVMLTLAFFAAFQSGQFGFDLTPTAIFIVAIYTTIFHGSIRVAAFVDLGYIDEDDSEHVERVRNRLFGFGFSFLMSVYLLGIISTGVGLATGNLGPNVSLGDGEINLIVTLSYVVLTVGAIIATAYLSEWFLKKTEVKDCLKEPA